LAGSWQLGCVSTARQHMHPLLLVPSPATPVFSVLSACQHAPSPLTLLLLTQHAGCLQVLVDSVNIPGFDDLMVPECMRLLEDDEVRVRLAVGQLLRSLATKHGLSVLQTCQDTVLNSIHTHFVSGGNTLGGVWVPPSVSLLGLSAAVGS
jgi:hypothetical protein